MPRNIRAELITDSGSSRMQPEDIKTKEAFAGYIEKMFPKSKSTYYGMRNIPKDTLIDTIRYTGLDDFAEMIGTDDLLYDLLPFASIEKDSLDFVSISDKKEQTSSFILQDEAGNAYPQDFIPTLLSNSFASVFYLYHSLAEYVQETIGEWQLSDEEIRLSDIELWLIKYSLFTIDIMDLFYILFEHRPGKREKHLADYERLIPGGKTRWMCKNQSERSWQMVIDERNLEDMPQDLSIEEAAALIQKKLADAQDKFDSADMVMEIYTAENDLDIFRRMIFQVLMLDCSIKECSRCNRLFIAESINTKYCSDVCRKDVQKNKNESKDKSVNS